MVTQAEDFKFVQSLLYEDELINSPMIRLLDTPEPDALVWMNNAPEAGGVLFVQSPGVGTWDAAQYPVPWRRVWLESCSPSGVDGLLEYLPKNRELLFKFHRPWIAAHVTRRLPLARKQALRYLTLPADRFVDRPKHGVMQLTSAHVGQVVDLMTRTGRSTENLRQALSHPDAAAFGCFCDGRLVSGAYVEPRTKRTAEICALYTHRSHRGQGLAASVVSAATAWILERGNLPVYATRVTNAASIRLAQTIGYTVYGEIAHYYCSGVS